MLLHEIVEFSARRSPDGVALVAGPERRTFAELHRRVEAVAGALGEMAGRGERVAVLSENTPAYVELYYAVPRAGLVLAPLNHRLHPEEWVGALRHVGASVVVGERALLDRLVPLLGGVPTVGAVVCTDAPRPGEVAYEELVAHGAAPAPMEGQRAGDVAWLLFTSGTTGAPKAAMLTHGGLIAGALATSMARGVRSDDAYLFPFPLCHVAGYNVLLFHLHARPVVLMPRFDADGVLGVVDRERITIVSLAPTMISMLLRHPGLAGADLSSLRSVWYGASGIPVQVLREGLARLGCGFEQGYGMTELSGNAAFLDSASHRRGAEGDDRLLEAAGRPGPLVAMRVVDDAMEDVPVGETGEIVVRGDQVTAGYWDDPAATAEAFAGGWFHTGDLGRFDDEGYLYVVDRKKDVIVTGGENVSSREVEEVLHRHPCVLEAAVVAVPDEQWGEAVCAVVVTRPGTAVSEGELVSLCRDHLAGFKKPRHVVFVDELPKNAAGKIVKQQVREVAARTVRSGL